VACPWLHTQVPAGLVIQGEYGSDGHGANHGLQHTHRRHGEECRENNQYVDGHLDFASAQALRLLKPLGEDVDATYAGSKASRPNPMRKPPSTDATQGFKSSNRTAFGASAVQAETSATARKLLRVNSLPRRCQDSQKNGRLKTKKHRAKLNPLA